MGDPPGGQRVAERTGDGVLPDDVVERRGPVFPREDLIRHCTPDVMRKE